ncbi:hypothetical protein HID58_026771, partial [Brassica napus]
KNTQANDFEDISEIIKALNISTDDFAIRTTRFWKINFAPDKSLKLTESTKPKPTELFRVSSVGPTTCLGEHQQTATCQEHNQRPFTGVSTCNALTLRLESLKDLKAFAEAIDVVRDKGVAMAVAVASAEDIDAANVHVQTFSEVKKAL